MDIVSYRGPGKAGGVSTALSRIWDDQQSSQAGWWYLLDNALAVQQQAGSASVARLPKEIVDGHYRYCNEFLWPVMHGLPQCAIFRAGDRRYYQQLNLAISEQLEQAAGTEQRLYFMQDYQLSLVPSMMAVDENITSLIFWHIPWPAAVQEIHLPPVLEVARALLSSLVIGFHTREYALNFLRFVETHLPGCRIDPAALTVSANRGRAFRPMSPYAQTRLPAYGRQDHTRILVAPLGVDMGYWQKLAAGDADIFADPRFKQLSGKRYVLSVDRADYTKGVLERIAGIDYFLQREPEWAGQVTFLQLCGRTRPGLSVFDAYWQKCLQAAEQLQSKWGTSFWKPLIWVDSPVSFNTLAGLYRWADVMLVNPLRDGLNLTAKEFVACQQEDEPGVLVLSPGAGAWHELGDYCLLVDPAHPDQLAASVSAALSMGRLERQARLQLLKDQVANNSLDFWYGQFQKAAGYLKLRPVAP